MTAPSPAAVARPGTVSVVICVHTEERWHDIAAAVASVRAQRHPAHELLLVVDHCPGLLARLGARYGGAGAAAAGITVVDNPGPRGLSAARNTGIAAATGELIAFLDDDAVAEPDWLRHLVAAYDDPRVLAVGGRTEPAWDGGRRPVWFPEELDWAVGCTYRGHPPGRVPVRNVLGGNASFRRSVFAAAGGFTTGIGRDGARLPLGCEETELCIRLRRLMPEAVLLVDDRAVIHHRVPRVRARPGYLRSRCFAEGLSKARVAGLVGARDGLATERAYTTRVLPLGVLRGLRDALLGRPGGAGRAGAILLGAGAAAAGYALGRAGALARGRAGPEAPAASPASAAVGPSTSASVAPVAPATPHAPASVGPDARVPDVLPDAPEPVREDAEKRTGARAGVPEERPSNGRSASGRWTEAAATGVRTAGRRTAAMRAAAVQTAAVRTAGRRAGGYAAGGRSRSGGAVPVLMYHAVTDRPARATRRLSVAPAAFAQQLEMLAAHRCTPVTTAQLAAAWRGAGPLPPRPVLLTFDDGYAGVHTHALPELARHGFAASLFVTTGWLPGPHHTGGALDTMLTWDQVRELAASGVEIGGHSHTHPQLDQLDEPELRTELVRCRELLAEATGEVPVSFAYPFGYSSRRVRRAVRASGYDQALAVGNTLAGPGQGPYALTRLTVRRSTGPAEFERLLEGRALGRNFAPDRALGKGYAVVRRTRRAAALAASAAPHRIGGIRQK